MFSHTNCILFAWLRPTRIHSSIRFAGWKFWGAVWGGFLRCVKAGTSPVVRSVGKRWSSFPGGVRLPVEGAGVLVLRSGRQASGLQASSLHGPLASSVTLGKSPNTSMFSSHHMLLWFHPHPPPGPDQDFVHKLHLSIDIISIGDSSK